MASLDGMLRRSEWSAVILDATPGRARSRWAETARPVPSQHADPTIDSLLT